MSARNVVAARHPELEPARMRSLIERFADRIGALSGAFPTFMAACMIILVWGVSGPAFGFSDTWQLVINTGTTIVTFLMAFLIQNGQNRADNLRRRLAQHDHARLARLEDKFNRLAAHLGLEE